MSKKVRLDALLAERCLFPSRTAAAQAVRAGEVRLGIDGPKALKPGQLVNADVSIVIAERARFVSRGGEKLSNALDDLGVDVSGRRCLDVGASTGGFTDCLLQRGATEVIALDVAYGQLDDRLRRDPRVTEIPRVNAREVSPDLLPFVADLATIDVSFISAAKILPAVSSCVREDGRVLVMVKPQFELTRREVGRGGVVRDRQLREKAIISVVEAAEPLGLGPSGFAYSGLPGPKGNKETFVAFDRDRGGWISDPEAFLSELDV